MKRQLEHALSAFKTGSARDDVSMASEILEAIREGWMFGSLEHGAHKVRSAYLLAAILSDPVLRERAVKSAPELGNLKVDQLQREMKDLLPRVASEENAPGSRCRVGLRSGAVGSAQTSGKPAATGGGKTPALDQFTVNLTEQAKAGEIDPVIGRDFEIRQVIDILTRRRQNNPILTGEAGVGKTAVVEGLRPAHRRRRCARAAARTCSSARSTSACSRPGPA